MRRTFLVIVPLILMAVAAAIVMGGRQRAERETVAAIEAPPAAAAAPPALPAERVGPVTPEPSRSRVVAPELIVPPPVDTAIEREAPRPPLSRLSLALPPVVDLAKGAKLFRPVAVESAVVESMGRRVAIAGTESVPPDETCVHEGVAWPCGVSARTAFRLWLRGRALDCAMPDVEDRTLLVASCRLGKRDAGAWLVANGWARAAAGGPYVKAQISAEATGRGIFGPPPDTGGLRPPPDAPAFTPLADQSVLAE